MLHHFLQHHAQADLKGSNSMLPGFEYNRVVLSKIIWLITICSKTLSLVASDHPCCLTHIPEIIVFFGLMEEQGTAFVISAGGVMHARQAKDNEDEVLDGG
jgi:hypothetical protein